MKTFLEFFQQITEKQIQYGKNANYGQIVFFAGGAGSGKGFSISNFIDSSKFKIRDVDQLKVQMLKMKSLHQKYPELATMTLKNPDNVFKLHQIAKKEGIPAKQIMSWISGMKNPDTLPNILFDITMKDLEDVEKYVPLLTQVGYKPENIHITWVLTNYEVAVVRNKQRERVVPDDILLKTHAGAALTVSNILKGGLPKSVNGSITVILNNLEDVKYYDKAVPVYNKTNKFSSSPVSSKLDKGGAPVFASVIRDFKYITLKKSGQPLPAYAELDKEIKNTLYNWVKNNVPKNNLELKKAFEG
jgi:hypothetical protein